MTEITLKSTERTLIVSTENNEEVLFSFVDWLEKYNYIEYLSGYYKIKSENRLRACRLKAIRLGLTANFA